MTNESSVDWHQQWAEFAPQFENGMATIHLDPYDPLKLVPGAGFGDLSHPTTRLMLELMKNRCEQQTVLDIGCGSGILTLAAARMGAAHAHGIDIDLLALEHCERNQKLNDLGGITSFSYTWEKNPTLILMNMIIREQQIAWDAQKLPSAKRTIITSGVLASQRDRYLALTNSWRWTCREEREEEGWFAFFFTQSIF
jgi:ribosomal protein L11 methyltransferase